MRPPEEVKRELVRQWLKKAEEDWAAANVLLAEDAPVLSAIGFHTQQVAEKHLKAFLTWHQVEFPKTHNLGELLDLISRVDASLAESLREITVLNPYGVDVRYPAEFPEMTDEDAQQAMELAGAVRDTILAALEETT